MKVFFRKHGNSVFYIVLPVFFLLLTVAFIQLTPQKSVSEPFMPCDPDGDCCNVSGCNGAAGEECVGVDGVGTCIRTNVFCPNGTDPDDTPNGCTCPDDNNVDCIVCQTDEIFFEADGVCVRVCAPDEDAVAGNCFQVEGSGEAFDCAASLMPVPFGNALGGGASMLFGVLMIVVFRLRKFLQK